MRNKVFLIIPAYNEAGRIDAVLREAKKYCQNIIVVDDGSEDETSLVAEKNKVLVLRHRVNLGKGAALKTGIEAAMLLGAEILVLMDADGQHNPRMINSLVNVIFKGHDLALGMRVCKRKMPLAMRFGNAIFSGLINYLFDFNFKDTQCGFRAMRANIYSIIKWKAQGYEVETEMLLNALKNHLTIAASRIETIYYDNYKGTTVLDGAKIIEKIIEKRILR